MLPSSRVHLLILDDGDDDIARSVQLAAGRAVQQYNSRNIRQRAFREDR